jgi:hypothetical protein
MSGAPYGGRFGDPAALREAASQAKKCAAKVASLAGSRKEVTDLDAKGFKSPLTKRWKSDGKKAGEDLMSLGMELRSIASFLEDAADTAADMIKAQQARDAEARRKKQQAKGSS